MTHVDADMLDPLGICEVLFGKDETGKPLEDAPVENILSRLFSN